LIEEADKLNDTAQTRAAVTKYLEAQVGLKNLQSAYPEWNPKIVAYRIQYIGLKLDGLTQKLASAAPAAPNISPGQALTNQLNSLQEEITRLANQNALLEAKLKEALSVQPAAMDPRELAKAEERIKQLQKERDLLAVTLEQAKAQAAAVRAANDADKARQELEETKQRLISQTAVASVLQKQNEDLQKQLTEFARKLKKPGQSVEAFEAGLAVKEQLAMLQASNRILQAEQVAMENRLMDWVRRYGANSSAKEKEWERQLAAAQKERDELITKLNDVTRELNQRSSQAPPAAATSTAELERQMEALRSKLEIFEARQVPYTPEELALFKQPAIKLATAETNLPPPAPVAPAATTALAAATSPTNAPASKKKNPRELPPGAGPLVAEAQRAIDAERFEEAEKKYQEVLRQDENNVYVLANLAAVQMDQDKTADAEKSLTRALAVDAQDPASLYMMGNLRLKQEKYDEAIDLLSQSARLNPEKPQTQFFLGKALIQKGSRGPAETALRKAVQLKPGWGEPHYLLAVLYATQQPSYPELAQYHYKKAIAGGAPRNFEFERWMENRAQTSARQ
jgi:Flp pilus assembly protein TadD